MSPDTSSHFPFLSTLSPLPQDRSRALKVRAAQDAAKKAFAVFDADGNGKVGWKCGEGSVRDAGSKTKQAEQERIKQKDKAGSGWHRAVASCWFCNGRVGVAGAAAHQAGFWEGNETVGPCKV